MSTNSLYFYFFLKSLSFNPDVTILIIEKLIVIVNCYLFDKLMNKNLFFINPVNQFGNCILPPWNLHLDSFDVRFFLELFLPNYKESFPRFDRKPLCFSHKKTRKMFPNFPNFIGFNLLIIFFRFNMYFSNPLEENRKPYTKSFCWKNLFPYLVLQDFLSPKKTLNASDSFSQNLLLGFSQSILDLFRSSDFSLDVTKRGELYSFLIDFALSMYQSFQLEYEKVVKSHHHHHRHSLEFKSLRSILRFFKKSFPSYSITNQESCLSFPKWNHLYFSDLDSNFSFSLLKQKKSLKKKK